LDFNVIIFVLAIWWGMFWWRDLEELSAQWYFFSNRHWFFGLQLAVILTDIPETLVKAAEHLRPMPKEYPFLISALLAMSVVGILSSRKRVHEALCLAWLLVTLGYTFFIPLMSKIVKQ
jgi:hypothetical protein